MKILLLTDEMDPGGVARHVTDLANGLGERGVRSVVAATRGSFCNRLQVDIPFVELPLVWPGTGKKRFYGLPSSYFILRDKILREKVTLIHTHKRYSDLLGRILARQFSLSHVSTCHSMFESLKTLTVFGDITVACSEAVRRMVVDGFGKPPQTVKRVYVGILPFREYTHREKEQVKNSIGAAANRIVASVGPLVEAKDRVTLLGAIGILKRRNHIDDVLFVILGHGSQRAALERLIREEGFEKQVLFVGDTFNVEALINVSDFMVLSSLREGLPYVLLEAASLGKPHIATNVGGVSEFVIDGETGILVPPGSRQALADAIYNFLQSPQTAKRLGVNARQKYLRQFTYERFIDQTLEIYRSVH